MERTARGEGCSLDLTQIYVLSKFTIHYFLRITLQEVPMSAPVRVLASFVATLSATHALGDIRPIPGGTGPVVVPIPAPGHGPGRGPGYPNPNPGYPQPGHGPGYPTPGNGYPPPPPGYPPNPYPDVETFACRDIYGGYDFVNIRSTLGRRADYRVDLNALGISATNLKAFVSNRINDSMLLQIQTPYGLAQFTIGYLSHPYGPTAILSLSGSYEEFRCARSARPAPPPSNPPYPPAPYPPSPLPFPHR